jgi:hypothetical protein
MTTKTVIKRAFKLPEKAMSLGTAPSDNNKAHAQKVGIDPHFIPTTEGEMTKCLADPLWRTCSGQLYKIMVKSPDGEDNSVLPFIPNRAQRRLNPERPGELRLPPADIEMMKL